MDFYHLPIMLNECIDGLNIRPDGDYLDCTLGGGGHSSEICRHLHGGRLFGIDRDAEAIAAATARLSAVDGARDVVNQWSEDDITRVLTDFGEEKWARQIARVICDRRTETPIETAAQLVSIIDAAIPRKFRPKDGSHPARRTFQALRIAVNDELTPLEAAIRDLVDMLRPGGRICIITFHSLEDRIVKNCFRNLANPCTCPPGLPVCVCGKKPVVRLITRKPVTASEQELAVNPRARSASLRIAEKL